MEVSEHKRRVVVAITGASGAIYPRLLLNTLQSLSSQIEELAIVFSKNAKDIWMAENGSTPSFTTPAKEYDNKSFFAPFASGSSSFDTMIICPTSMGCMGRIANGIADDLITRAADVTIKERRRLILVPRETPYSLIHIKNMETLTLAGAIICPANPSFYGKPETIEEVAMTVVERIIVLAGFNIKHFQWME